MADEPDDPANLTLAHLRALRREFALMQDTQQAILKVVTRMDRDIREMRADIHTLENNAINHHTELLRALRKVEHIDDEV